VALQAQATEALDSVWTLDAVRLRFLQRSLDVSPELTFALDELLFQMEDPLEARPAPDAMACLERVAAAMPEAPWVAVVAGVVGAGRGAPPIASTVASVVRMGGGPSDGRLVELTRILVAEEIQSAVIRSANGSLLYQCIEKSVGHSVGPSVGPGEECSGLWCGVRGDAKLGVLTTLVAESCGSGRRTAEGGRHEAPWVHCSAPGILQSEAPLEAAMALADDLLAVLVFSPGEARGASVARTSIDLPRLSSQAGRMSRLLLSVRPAELLPPDAPNVVGMASSDRDPVRLRAVDERFSHFATAIPGPEPLYLWLVLSASASQGLGWALLGSLARQTADCVCHAWAATG
jgi:hypothetical protein